MAAFLDDIATALVTAGIGQITSNATDWFIFRGYFQDAPDRAICLYETPGVPPEEGLAIEYPGLQVRARGTLDDYQAARLKMQEIFDFLHGGEAAIGAAYVYFYAVQSGVIPMGQDANRRPHIVQNYRSMRSR